MALCSVTFHGGTRQDRCRTGTCTHERAACIGMSSTQMGQVSPSEPGINQEGGTDGPQINTAATGGWKGRALDQYCGQVLSSRASRDKR